VNKASVPSDKRSCFFTRIQSTLSFNLFLGHRCSLFDENEMSIVLIISLEMMMVVVILIFNAKDDLELMQVFKRKDKEIDSSHEGTALSFCF